MRRLALRLRARPPRFVFVAARGTSDNAARYAQYAFGLTSRLPVALAAPSLTTLYHRSPRLRDALAIGISQSGRSPDVVEALAAARRSGAFTLAIVNDTGSPLAKAAHEVIPLGAGEERSIAATKTYTAQLAAVALLAASISGSRRILYALQEIPQSMQSALEGEGTEGESTDGERADGESIVRAARVIARASRSIVVARGVNYPTAFEIALKLKELALLGSEPYSSADFMHGPVAMAGDGLVAVLVSPPGTAAQKELSLLAGRLRRVGSHVVGIGRLGPGSLTLPEVPELLSPLVAVLPGQLLAFHSSRALGLDPDSPRGLSKVTETR